MEHVKGDLRSLLLEHFQIAPIPTNRADQWYKRVYNSWDKSKGEPLILVPKDSREEWAPRVLQFSKSLASALRAEVNSPAFKRHYKHVTSLPPDTKLFPQKLIDEAYASPLCSAFAVNWNPYWESRPQPVEPVMQQLSFWTSNLDRKETDANTKYRRHQRIKGLIACGATEPLLRIATWRQTRPHKEKNLPPSAKQWNNLNAGWQGIIDDTLEVLFFLALLDAFPEQLVADDGYERWAPYAFRHLSTAHALYIHARGGELPKTEKVIQKEMDQCLEVLRAAEAWSEASGFEPVKWEAQISNGFLEVKGFEALNREREGEGYLRCLLNVGKHESWLRQAAGEDGQDDDVSDVSLQMRNPSEKSHSLPKPIDPLRLREPKKEPEPELDPDEKEHMEALAVLESEEADYGRKRSTKYAPRRRDQGHQSL